MSRLRLTSLFVLAGLIATTAVYAGRMPNKEKHYASKDVRVFVPHPKDTQGWRSQKIAEDQKNVMLVLVYKRPDSENNYDAQFVLIAYPHGQTLSESKISTGNVAKIAELEQKQMAKRFKVIKSQSKLRKVGISRDAGKGRHFAIEGTVDKQPLPSKNQVYVFTAHQKTYILRLYMPLNAANDKQTMTMVTKMIKGIRTWKP